MWVQILLYASCSWSEASAFLDHSVNRCSWAQVTLWNFLQYNVAGGGDSSLYGVESGTFYLRNALTNLNLVAPLAILVPLSALFLMSQKRGQHLTLTLCACCLTS